MNQTSYAEKTKAELRSLLEEAGVAFDEDAKKDDLVALAEEHLPKLDAEASEEKQTDESEEEKQDDIVAAHKEKSGCNPSHQHQRAAVGSGHLNCSQCGKEIPNEFKKVVIDGVEHTECPDDHDEQRAAVGAGHLVCRTCKQDIPNQ